MSCASSASTSRSYGVALVCAEWGWARSSFYAARARRRRPPGVLGRREPKGPLGDQELIERIRGVLSRSPFVGEGHRKVWARLRLEGIRTSKRRCLRLMREAGLLCPGRPVRELGPPSHEGSIVAERPNEMWGTDATRAWTTGEAGRRFLWRWIIVPRKGLGSVRPRWGIALRPWKPIRQGVRRYFGGFGPGIAAALKLRHDHGSQYLSDAFQEETAFLGIESSPAFVRSPEGNGCAERFIRTLKEQLLWVRTFRTVEELRLALQEWLRVYNEHGLIERHGYRSPAQVRREYLVLQEAA
ncbi:MAG: integrase [Pirellulaceae bacterium]|nr:MAG: integrase [Pirellulaceae bacterium]